MFNHIFITGLHLDLLMKPFLIIFGNNIIFHSLILTQLGTNLYTPPLQMKNSLKLSLNFLTTKPVVLQALVMKCSNTSALNALLLLLVSLTVAFLKTEFLSNGNTAE